MKKRSILILMIVLGLVSLTACESSKKKNDSKYNYLVLVNKYSQLPDDWEKKVELVNTKNAWEEDIQVEKQAFNQYQKLKKEVEKDLKKYNTTIELDSTYRSVKAQQELWDDWSNDPEKGLEYVKKFVAVPGYSEHHTGLAIDICLKKDGELIYDNDEMIAEREIFSKIHAKLSKYGFILRYLENKDAITGYAYEPWHLRYIGNPKIAQEIMDKNITLEEYFEKETDLVNNLEAAKYQIERKLTEEFENDIYKEKIDNIRFNVKKIMTYKDKNQEEIIKKLKLTKNDLAFEIEYQIHPKEGIDIEQLMVVDGEYNTELGWITNINRLGVMRYNNKKKQLELESFGSGW